MNSHWRRFKSGARSVFRRIGVFFGIGESEELASWKNRIDYRLQEGEIGIPLQNLFSRKKGKYEKLASELEEALSHVTVDSKAVNRELKKSFHNLSDVSGTPNGTPNDEEVCVTVETSHSDETSQSSSDSNILDTYTIQVQEAKPGSVSNLNQSSACWDTFCSSSATNVSNLKNVLPMGSISREDLNKLLSEIDESEFDHASEPCCEDDHVPMVTAARMKACSNALHVETSSNGALNMRKDVNNSANGSEDENNGERLVTGRSDMAQKMWAINADANNSANGKDNNNDGENSTVTKSQVADNSGNEKDNDNGESSRVVNSEMGNNSSDEKDVNDGENSTVTKSQVADHSGNDKDNNDSESSRVAYSEIVNSSSSEKDIINDGENSVLTACHVVNDGENSAVSDNSDNGKHNNNDGDTSALGKSQIADNSANGKDNDGENSNLEMGTNREMGNNSGSEKGDTNVSENLTSEKASNGKGNNSDIENTALAETEVTESVSDHGAVIKSDSDNFDVEGSKTISVGQSGSDTGKMVTMATGDSFRSRLSLNVKSDSRENTEIGKSEYTEKSKSGFECSENSDIEGEQNIAESENTCTGEETNKLELADSENNESSKSRLGCSENDEIVSRLDTANSETSEKLNCDKIVEKEDSVSIQISELDDKISTEGADKMCDSETPDSICVEKTGIITTADKPVKTHIGLRDIKSCNLEDIHITIAKDALRPMARGLHKIQSLPVAFHEDQQKHVRFKSTSIEVILPADEEIQEADTELDISDDIDINPNSVENNSEEELTEKDFACGKEGYRHYKLFVEIEKKIKIQELEESKERIKSIYEWNIEKIDEIMNKAKAYYMDPTGDSAKEWKDLWKDVKRSSDIKLKYPKSITDIRVRLSKMPVYWPFFTVFIIVAQLVSFGVICGLGGLTYIGLEPKLELQDGVKSFLGTETIHKWVPPNIWIGPSEMYMISVGASFAPCMREDYGILIDYTKVNYSVNSILGCCEVAIRNTAGTTTEDECQHFTNGIGKWKEKVLCSARLSGQNSIEHNLKPCCVNTKGICQLTSHKHCTFIGGIYHQRGPEHCSKVNCLSAICGFGGLKSKIDKPWIPDRPDQFWRILLSLLYHHGIIHTVLVAIVQALILRQIERSAGWFRVMIIYLLSGVGGLMAAAIFTPYTPHVGGTGALFGFVGVTLIELIHFWKIIRRPVLELAKIIIALVFFLVSGTLPYINNFTIIVGFIIGLLSACAFLPYITFGKWHKRVRVVLVFVTIPLLVLFYFVLLFVFYRVQTVEGCTICNQINCVPYNDKMCNSSLWRS